MADMPRHLYRLRLSGNAKSLLAYLWTYAGRDRFVWPARETIAADLGIESGRTLRRHFSELRQAGVLRDDVELRRGEARDGWWLLDGDVAAGSAPTPTSPPGRACDATPRPKMAAPPDKNGRARTKMAASPAKNGRPSSIELPINQDLSLNWRRHQLPEQGDERASDPLEALRRWRVDGGDPDGLGPWPRPRTPNGLELPTLAMSSKIAGLLAEERTPEQLHQAVHLVATLVEAGELAPDRWRAGYVFSGWLDELVVRALELRDRRQRAKAHPREPDLDTEPKPKPKPKPASDASMLAALESSSTLTGLAVDLRQQRRPRRATSSAPTPQLRGLDLRIELDAIAVELGRTPAEVLRALGRTSPRELEADDKPRLRRALVELQRGATVEQVAALWSGPPAEPDHATPKPMPP